jgi:hypothetical protein
VDAGTVNVSSTSVEYNSATGGPNPSNCICPPGDAYGGGIAVYTGGVTLSGDVIENNTATGGPNANSVGGNAYGGGLYVGGGTVTLCDDMVEFNTATGGIGSNGSPNGQGFGGGIYIASAATVYIDDSTMDMKDPTVVNNNTDSSGTSATQYSSTANIDGTYIRKNC